MNDMSANINRANAYLGRSVHNVLLFYSKRRKPILRITYLLIIYLIFNNGSKSRNYTRNFGKGEKSELLKTVTTRKRDFDKGIFKNKTYLQKLMYKFKNIPIIIIFSQLSLKDKKALSVFSNCLLQVILLAIKALITLKTATLDGYLVSSLISRKFRRFFKYLFIWLLLGLPSSLVDSLIEKSKRTLSQNLRSSITSKILDDYLPENGTSTIYQLLNNHNLEVNITDPNHRLTSTIEHFANSFSILPSQLLLPVTDIIIAGNHLSKTSENSSEGGVLLGVVANVCTIVLKLFTPNFSMLNNMRNTLENKFHEFHSNIISNKEEIALAKGHGKEIDLLDTSYFEFEKFERSSLRKMGVYNFAISFIFKYTMGAFGLLLCAVPTFTTVYMKDVNMNEKLISKLSSDFVTNRSLLIKAADSLGRLIQSKKNIQNMVGYANELWEFQKILIDINENSKIEASMNSYNYQLPSTLDSNIQPLLVGPNVRYGDEITFSHIPLITPNGNILVKDLTFSIKQGDNLLIIGPNGCGKSSLFRILGGLWDVKDPGEITVPYDKRDLFYLPQRSYFTYGSLREQIIYPDSYDTYRENILNLKMGNSNTIIKDDEYLVELLKKVHLEYLLSYDEDEDDEFNGNNNDANFESCVFMNPCLDRIERWPDLLSVGEQQRLAMIRLYYHQPKFAVLDECTSSISSDLERECYRITVNDLKITVLSVCHRTTLWSFHSKILKFKRIDENNIDEGDGAATTTFSSFDPQLRLERHEELITIENSLKRSDELTKRLNALKQLKKKKARRPAMMYIEDDEADD